MNMKKRIAVIMAALMMTLTTAAYAQPTASPSPTAEATASPEVSAEPDTSEEPGESEEPQESIVPEETEQPQETASPQPTAAADKEILSKTLDITVYLKQYALTVKSTLEMTLSDENGTELAKASADIKGGLESVNLHFDLPEYELGKKFKVSFSGVKSLTLSDKEYTPESEDFYIETFYWRDATGLVRGESFEMSCVPKYNKEVYLFMENGNQMYLSPGSYLAGDVAMVPLRQVAAHLGLDVRYVEKYNAVDLYIGDKYLSYKLGTTLMNVFGEDKQMAKPASVINDTAFVTAESIAEAFGSELKVWENDERRDIMFGACKAVEDYYGQFHVNKAGISSKTNYLIWVSKSEFKVRTYKGSKGKWRPIKEATCAIGAPWTPTITGQFTYFSKEHWDYGSYYVGPVMRFYNGYAIHSTLVNYDGTEYDGRVGVMISHGCVRLHPVDINWLAANIPYGTKIYITE